MLIARSAWFAKRLLPTAGGTATAAAAGADTKKVESVGGANVKPKASPVPPVPPTAASATASGGNGAVSGSGSEHVITISGDMITPSAFLALLQFLYTDSVADVTPELAEKLLAASDSFELPGLRAKCATLLCANESYLTVENVFRLYETAMTIGRNANVLLRACLKCMHQNWSTIVKGDALYALPKPVLQSFLATLTPK